MEFKFIIRIKAEHNPPVFKEELGKGVVATQVIDYKVTEEDLLPTLSSVFTRR